jgi:hypothetical protein
MSGMHRLPFFLLIAFISPSITRAQDTLPHFSVMVRGAGKILVSWHNPFATVTQISIQRSSDSLKDFTTLLTVPDPMLPENGAVDGKAPDPNFYYRLFIVLEGGNYLFSHSQRPHTAIAAKQHEAQKDAKDIDPDEEKEDDASLSRIDNQRIRFAGANPKDKPEINGPVRIRELPKIIEIEKPVFVKKADSLIGQISSRQLRAFRDSVLNRTKDTLVFINGDTVQIRPFVPKEVYRVSAYVYTGKYGNIHLSLPDAGKKHYSVKFFDDGDKLLFELSAIKDPSLILDKTNFLHAGWFRYELYEDNQLKEKNKLFIPKEF